MESHPSIISSFIALWDETIGPVVIGKSPDPAVIPHLEEIAVNIFMTFQTVFGVSNDVQFSRSILTLPLKSQDLMARILLEVVPNKEVRAGLQPFIVVALIPGDMLEETIKTFDPILERIAKSFKEKGNKDLQGFHNDFQNAYQVAQQVDDLGVHLEAGYSLQDAIASFKTAITLIQSKQMTAAYPILKQAMMKFEQEKQIKLTLEASYMLGTLLVQLKKFEPAAQHFHKTMDLAKAEPKYQELFKFMLAFCYFKLNDNAKALKELKEIPIAETKFVNQIQYFSMLAHVELKFDKYDEAIKDFQTCLQITSQAPSSPAMEIQMAQLHYELGFTLYNFAGKKIQMSISPQPETQVDASTILSEAAENFEKAARLWDANSDYSQAISTYELLANIYRILNQPETELETLVIALDKANSIKSELQKIRITKRIVQIQESLGKQQDSVKYLQDLQASIQDNTLVDLITASKTHLDTGKTFLAIKKYDEAAKELVAALNSFRRLKVRQQEELDALKLLIDLYTATGETDKVNYYSGQLQSTATELQKVIPVTVDYAGSLQEVWIYSHDGKVLFNYNFEKHVDIDSLGGFLSAVKSFSIEFEKDQKYSRVIGNSRFTFYRESKKVFFAIGRSDEHVSEESILQGLKSIYARFKDIYDSTPERARNDPTSYKSFQQTFVKTG